MLLIKLLKMFPRFMIGCQKRLAYPEIATIVPTDLSPLIKIRIPNKKIEPLTRTEIVSIPGHTKLFGFHPCLSAIV